jgi:hypothetical protein
LDINEICTDVDPHAAEIPTHSFRRSVLEHGSGRSVSRVKLSSGEHQHLNAAMSVHAMKPLRTARRDDTRDAG